MRALISVSDKTGVVRFAGRLLEAGWELISTSGTMKLLQQAGLPVTPVSEVTGFPEICDGRVKTLHPKIHGALLARRETPAHLRQLEENGIVPIDLVCVNLYPFRETVARPDTTMEEAVEQIDIGGPSMLRSAAKNWKSVTVVVHPEDYAAVLEEIGKYGNTMPETRLKLSAKAYTHTAEYDMAIATYMRRKAGLPEKLFLAFDEKQALRYGENPHQEAKFYRSPEPVPFSPAFAVQLNGKELSYNNIQDANAALDLLREFEEPCCVGLKHTNPCGVAVGKDIAEAWKKAYAGDKVSIFGGIVAANREVDLETAALLKPIFLEIVIAPSFSAEALALLRTKKNLRLLQADMTRDGGTVPQYVSVTGGLLVQQLDLKTKTAEAGQCVTVARPSEAQIADMNFGWKVVKHVKSNAIVVVKDGMVYGVGAGQMNRIGSAEIALRQAEATFRAEGRDIREAGPALASDGFFPFDDCVTLAAEYGVRAVIQPGGSIRDEDSVRQADAHGMVMLMTGERHFRH